MSGAGRFAPSPTGDLHLGNLRTALLSWLFARSTDRSWLVRVEDLDTARVVAGSRERQLADLAALGLISDAAVVAQSDRADLYTDAVERLDSRGLVYECFCSRREIAQAVTAPHAPPGAYPGTCRELTEAERTARRASGRPPALRLRAPESTCTVSDLLHGNHTGAVDDLVLMRGDGTPAYNLAVVVDDGEQGIDQVVRGEDLLSSAPRQRVLGSLLGYPPAQYVHVPLALGPTGARLAKRDGAVTLEALREKGLASSDVLGLLARSIGVDAVEVGSAADVLRHWDAARMPRTPWFPDM